MSRVLGLTVRPIDEPPALAGGALCLDFANTVDDRTESNPVDYLPSYDALVAWSLHSGAVSRLESDKLEELGSANPERAAQALATAISARESIYSVFGAAAAGGQLTASALAPLNRVLKRIGGVPRLVPQGGEVRLEWDDPPDLTLDTTTRRALRSAVELLTGPELERVAQCAAPDCSWLFLDLTRNHSRRWCRAEGCGVRNRFRRYYARHRKNA